MKPATDGYFRKPLGLVLCGGGSLGAWQAGFIEGMIRHGIAFDKVSGFSAGALNGSRYFIGWTGDVVDRWRHIDREKPLQWSPRLWPLSLCSDRPLRDGLRDLGDEERVMARGSCDLEVITLRLEDARHVYFHFGSKGRPWHGPIAEKLAASCAIPLVFPPVEIVEDGKKFMHVDGGVPGCDRLRFDFVAGCRDVIALDLVRPEEVGRRCFWPLMRRDQAAREVVYRHMSDGIASLAQARTPPRTFRVGPSQILDFTMLTFRPEHCSPAVDLGAADAERFLKNPSTALVDGGSIVNIR